MPPGVSEGGMTAPVLDSQLDDLLFGCLRLDFTPLVQHQTVGDALALIRSQGLGERIVYFYVVDHDERLVGVIPTRRPLTADPATPLDRLMVRDVVTLPANVTLRDASRSVRPAQAARPPGRTRTVAARRRGRRPVCGDVSDALRDGTAGRFFS
jgi:CBS domain-containing protein